MDEGTEEKMPARNAYSLAVAGERSFAPVVLRIGLSLVILWFGVQELLYTSSWVKMIPDWAASLSGLRAETLVQFNGAFEIVFGLCLLLGFFTRVVSFFLALHMFLITFVVGYNAIGIRDFGLSMAAISSFLYGVDSWSLDKFLEKRNIIS